MLTKENLLLTRPHPHLGGRQHIYRFPSGFGLSLVNAPMLHHYPFAWEAAVLKNVSEDGEQFELTYDTELTNDVEVFFSSEEADQFIARAADVLSCTEEKAGVAISGIEHLSSDAQLLFEGMAEATRIAVKAREEKKGKDR